jgi:hypothetical protein
LINVSVGTHDCFLVFFLQDKMGRIGQLTGAPMSRGVCAKLKDDDKKGPMQRLAGFFGVCTWEEREIAIRFLSKTFYTEQQ